MGPSLRSMTTKELLLSCHHELGRPQQGAFDFGIGKNADGVARGIGVAGGFFRGVFEGTVAVEDGEDIVYDLEGNAEIAAVLAEALFLGGGGASQDAAYSHADGKQTGGFAVVEI